MICAHRQRITMYREKDIIDQPDVTRVDAFLLYNSKTQILSKRMKHLPKQMIPCQKTRLRKGRGIEITTVLLS